MLVVTSVELTRSNASNCELTTRSSSNSGPPWQARRHPRAKSSSRKMLTMKFCWLQRPPRPPQRQLPKCSSSGRHSRTSRVWSRTLAFLFRITFPTSPVCSTSSRVTLARPRRAFTRPVFRLQRLASPQLSPSRDVMHILINVSLRSPRASAGNANGQLWPMRRCLMRTRTCRTQSLTES